MPKMKTHKGTAKVCKVRPGGSIKIGHPGTRHRKEKCCKQPFWTFSFSIK